MASKQHQDQNIEYCDCKRITTSCHSHSSHDVDNCSRKESWTVSNKHSTASPCTLHQASRTQTLKHSQSISIFSILVLTVIFNTLQLFVQAYDSNHHTHSFKTVFTEKWLEDAAKSAPNTAITVVPRIFVGRNAHLFVRLKVVHTHAGNSTAMSDQTQRLHTLIGNELILQLQPLKNKFIDNDNLIFSWNTNANDEQRSLVEHRRRVRQFTNDNAQAFFKRLSRFSLLQNCSNLQSTSASSLSSSSPFSSLNSSSFVTNNDHDDKAPKICQFFGGTVLNQPKTSTPNTQPTSTLSICEDGTTNGFVNWPPYGQILLQQNKIQKCSFWKLSEMFKKRNNYESRRKKSKESILSSSSFSPSSSSSSSSSPLWGPFSSLLKLGKNYDKTYPEIRKYLIGCSHELQLIPIALQSLNNAPPKNKQNKRSVSFERNIEILVVADQSMEEYHGHALEPYIITLMTGVANIFEHSSIGNEINIRLVRIHIGRGDLNVWQDFDTPNELSSAQTALRRFCKWQRNNNYDNDNDPRHHDTAILLTRRDLCRNLVTHNSVFSTRKGKTLCDTLGLAHSGKICDPDSSCAIVEDNGLAAAFTIAHELGHVLGMPHDEEEKCRIYYNTTEGRRERSNWNNLHKGFKESNVMARMIDFHSHMWSWSPCSKHYITEFLDSGHGNCLIDMNSENLLDTFTTVHSYGQKRRSLPGTAGFYEPNAQCALVYGPNSTICTDMPTCRRLWCRTPESLGCKTQHMPWAEGTECAPGRWCQEGQCVIKTIVQPVNGDWGEWSEFSECSRPCGGGIRRSKRECNNPSPKNGGSYCLGRRIRYESCNTDPCSVHRDFREDQCAEFNGQTFNIPGISRNVIWTPEYNGILEHERCRLYCADSNSGKSFMLRERVVDGTPCSNDGYDICVNGHCLSAGCDRKLGSDVQLDICGVCGGDNSTCYEVSGTLHPKSVEHGYNEILRIPAGASNIQIRKNHNSTQHSENWFAMRTEEGEYMLNGKFVVNVYRRRWNYAGSVIEYSGVRNQTTEMINSTKAITKPVYIELLCVGVFTPPMIEYSYSIEKMLTDPHVESDNRYINKLRTRNRIETKNEYRWIYEDNKNCSRICRGDITRHPQCIRIQNVGNGETKKRLMNDKYCLAYSPKPDPKMSACNLECDLEWNVQSDGGCLTKCGPGTRARTVTCRKVTFNQVHSEIVADHHCQEFVQHGRLQIRPDDYEACNGTECRAIHQWQKHAWNRCDIGQKPCGIGVQNRTIDCLRSIQYDNGEVVSEIVNPLSCPQPSPEINRECKIECPHWRTGEWSQCSATQCGVPGEKRRSLECVHGNSVTNEQYCLIVHSPKPEVHQFCMVACPTSTTTTTTTTSAPIRATSEPLRETFIDDNIPQGQSYQFIWTQSDPTLCRSLHKLLNSIESQTLIKYSLPKCLNSSYPLSLFEKNFKPLLTIERIFAERSIEKLMSVLGLNSESFKHKTIVKCIEKNSNREYSDSFCDPSTKPNEDVVCNIFENYRPIFKDFPIRNCTPEETSSKFDANKRLEASTVLPMLSPTTSTTPTPLIDSLSISELSLSFEFNPIKTAKSDPVSTSTLSNTIYEILPETKNSSTIEIAQWFYSNWTQCQPKCDYMSTFAENVLTPIGNGTLNGIRHRSAQCLDNKRFPINDSYCEDGPVVEEKCFTLQRCNNTVWKSDHWSECSSKCGNGTQTRRVVCHRLNSHGFVVPQPLNDHHCALQSKPVSSRNCNLGNCPTHSGSDFFVWQTLPWGPCSASCGEGLQKRKLKCIDFRHEQMNDMNEMNFQTDERQCDYKLRPETRRLCNIRSCSILSCKDIRHRSKNTAQDGEYNIWVQGAKIRVYCKGMQTAHPLEYLKLPSETDNYSQFHVKRSCNSNDVEIRKQYFSHVRLNPTSLEIMVSDTTFSYIIDDNQEHHNASTNRPISFGQAIVQGCLTKNKSNQLPQNLNHRHHMQKCNFNDNSSQDLFSINLENTGFWISPRQKWNKNSVVDMNPQKPSRIGGKCRQNQPARMNKHSGICQISCFPAHKTIQLIVP